MRISSVSNTTFGYNKNLNNKLIKKTTRSFSPESDALAEINSSCNSTEDIIRKLEGPRLERTVDNQEIIKILLNYLIGAKTYLASAVQEFYPELDYPITEVASYRNEMENIDLPDNAFDDEGETKDIFLWRSQLADSIEEGIDVKTDVEPIIIDESSKKKVKESLEKLVEKFTPSSYSPKGLEDVAGLKSAKADIEDLIIFPLKDPKEAKQRKEDYGIDIPTFTLLYGPPGCGKTMLAEAIATETDCTMYKLDLSKAGSTYVNGTVLNIKEAFDAVEKAAKSSKKPVILFMDEMDSILSKRNDSPSRDSEDNKVVNTLLPLITSLTDKNIMVIGATNMYDLLDPAAIRRADIELYIGLGDVDDIKSLLQKNLSKIKMASDMLNDEKALDQTAKKLLGHSPSNIVKMIKSASKLAYRERRQIQKEDFDWVLKNENFRKINEDEYLPEHKKSKKVIGFENRLSGN